MILSNKGTLLFREALKLFSKLPRCSETGACISLSDSIGNIRFCKNNQNWFGNGKLIRRKFSNLYSNSIKMSGFLFHDVIFGPVRSRRLGLSLGINLLPTHSKYCSFNCIYCECGWTPDIGNAIPELPSRELVREYLEYRLKELVEEDHIPDVLTYAGNGEPTMHPDFAGIVDDTLALRDKYMPGVKVSVLSNASMIADPSVFNAVLRLDNNIQKLDAGFERLFLQINNPVRPIKFDDLIENLKRFNGKVIIQSMFLKGSYKGKIIDNTNDKEVAEWLEHLRFISPSLVMIYPVSRATPVHNLEKIGIFELEKIAEKVRKLGIEAKVYN
jgi:wyosine [tRNA(Phe)-imidazoG37] synthetase (radical SAM superfamily)